MSNQAEDDIPELVSNEQNDQIPDLISNTNNNVQNTSEKTKNFKVPLTIVTGYLGAGKSTLLNYIANNADGHKIAFILNEFGDSSDIERQITITDRTNNGNDENTNSKKPPPVVEEWLELNNGCLCCSIKHSGVAAIESLMEKKGKFDHILLETTGIADPAPIAAMFWLDDGLMSSIYLNGIVTVVDACNLLKSLNDTSSKYKNSTSATTTHLQISHADLVILNKIDSVDKDSLNTISNRIKSINPIAKILKATYSQVPASEILNLHAYDGEDNNTIDSVISLNDSGLHDPAISTVRIDVPLLESLDNVRDLIESILWSDKKLFLSSLISDPVEIHRLKGLLYVKSSKSPDLKPTRFIVQGVREIYDIFESAVDVSDEDSSNDESYTGKLIFIGKGLQDANVKLQEMLDAKLK